MNRYERGFEALGLDVSSSSKQSDKPKAHAFKTVSALKMTDVSYSDSKGRTISYIASK